MLFSSAAEDALRTLLAFHFELSRIARRRPSRLFGRAAIGVLADSTTPRGSNTVTEFASVTFINMSVSSCFRYSAQAPSAHPSSAGPAAELIGLSTGVLM